MTDIRFWLWSIFGLAALVAVIGGLFLFGARTLFKRTVVEDRAVSAQAQAAAAEAVKNFPYPIKELPGEGALQALEAERASGRQAGYSAVLIGGEEALVSIAELMQMNGKLDPAATLQRAAGIEPVAWMKARREADPEQYAMFEGSAFKASIQGAMGIMAHLEVLSQKPRPKVYLVQVPVGEAWKIPAYLGLGAWNDCPEAAAHVAMQKRWHELYGAELVALTGDTMEFTVARPPSDPVQALALANEQFIYCQDLVAQGLPSVGDLAGALVNAKTWFFWWD